MKGHLCGACVALCCLLASNSAWAQSKVEDATRDCAKDYYKNFAVNYLTSNKVAVAAEAMLTTTSKKLEINKAGLTAALPKDKSDYTVAGLVSIPWTSTVPVRVNFTATGDQPVEITVCEYYRKSSAPAWDRFTGADLVASYGRTLKGVKGSANVELGRVKPSDTSKLAASRIVVVTVVNFQGNVSLTTSLKQSK